MYCVRERALIDVCYSVFSDESDNSVKALKNIFCAKDFSEDVEVRQPL